MSFFFKFGRFHLTWATFLSLAAGVGWLLLEFSLRGKIAPRIFFHPPFFVTAVPVVFLLGLAIPPRSSMSGERRAAVQFFMLVTTGFSFVFTALLVVYAGVLLWSLGSVAVLWLLVALVAFLAILLHVAVILLSVAVPYGLYKLSAFVNGDEKEEYHVKVAAVGTAVLAVICLATPVRQVYEFGLVDKAWDLGRDIPDFLYAFNGLRAAMLRLDLNAVISLLISLGSGVASGVALALVARTLRRWLMDKKVRLRPYIPLGTAPVGDVVPLIPDRYLAWVIGYVFVLWVALVAACAL